MTFINMQKIALVADQTNLAKELKKELIKKYDFIDLDGNKPFEHFDLVIVLGGDGFMLHSLHRFMNFDVKFYGINCGKVGFLLNSYNKEVDFYKKLELALSISIYPLQMTAIGADGSEKVKMAINEVYLARQSPQTAKIRIKVDHKTMMEEMSGDGVIVATAAGSSAYNFSVGGPIFPLESQILALTPIAPFRPKRWSGALLPSNSIIEFQVLESEKRPVVAVADFLEVHNCIKVIVKEDRKRAIKLLFDPNHSLEDRILKEQFCF